MKTVPEEQVIRRLQAENPWWALPHQIPSYISQFKRRAYFRPFLELIRERAVRRAVLLMGPRRVGKTVLIHHVIGELIANGVNPRLICYVSVDHPIYVGLGLEQLLRLFGQASTSNPETESCYVFFDEVQYLKGWETHLKTLVDDFRNLKLCASGSAAAALRLKSTESGAGRFTDFMLPPLTFHEYLDLLEITSDLIDLEPVDNDEVLANSRDIEELNKHFVRYLNIGGYPEALFSEPIQADPQRFIKSDIIDKVLLRDLPSLYGIDEIQELNSLFTTLAYNTANEVSLEELSKGSGVAKNTLKKYIEYLEAAFLIKTVPRIDRNARRFQRARFFKVYLTNPSIRAALFAPIEQDDEAVGSLAETGIFAQWFHDDVPLYYARWKEGEVDIVGLFPRNQKPSWAVEVKWSDRCVESHEVLRPLLDFCKKNRLREATVTTRTRLLVREMSGVKLEFVPASLYCYVVGHNVVEGRSQLQPDRAGRTLTYVGTSR